MMPLSMIFWILMLFWLVFGGWGFAPPDQRTPARIGGWLLLFILLGLLGWAVFGSAVK